MCACFLYITKKKFVKMASKKYLNLDQNVLLEWEYSSVNVTEGYVIWSDLTKNTRNFLSTTNINDIDHNLFVLDSTSKKYSKIDPTKFNFLRLQNYSTAPMLYDKVTLYFPSTYNFGVYYGFYLKIQALDYLNKKLYPVSNFYFDKTQAQSINGTIEYADQLMDLATPFTYNQKEWGKYITYYIPSIYETSNQRQINPSVNRVTPDSVNDHLTDGTGLSLTSPIYLEFSFISSKQTVFNIPYYYMGDIYKTSLSLQPEYQTLGVMIQESTQGDFFEIYGVYNNSNENMDNFVNDLESKGRVINIEYVVTLYEENLISGFPITFLVTENFAQKLEYRPIIKYSNTTAAIDVEMKIIDLVDSSSFSRFASIGLTKNLLKYGKTLSRLTVDNISKPKIYNYKYDKIYDLKTSSNITDISIVKVPFPILINNYKILANNYNPSATSDYKGMGLLNIIVTPFDNIIKFQIAKQDNANAPITPYNLSEVLLNSKLNLVFKSDTKTIEKEIYYQTDENKFELGVVVFKINQEDIPILKQMSKEKSDNFYIILNSNKTKTLLYSGKFKIFENLKFLDVKTTPTSLTGNTLVDLALKDVPDAMGGATSADATASAQLDAAKSGGVNDIIPPQFDVNGIPILQPGARGTLDSYRNMTVWVKAGISNSQIDQVVAKLRNLGIIIYYAYQTPKTTGTLVLILERVPVAKVSSIKSIPNVVNTMELPLDFGWKKTSSSINFSDFGTHALAITGSTTLNLETNLPDNVN
jgi:hypothetical protein